MNSVASPDLETPPGDHLPVSWRSLPSQTRFTLLALACCFILARLPVLIHPRPIDDEEVYSVVGMEMLHGGLPYRDAVERKPPLLFALYETVFQVAGPRNWFALHALNILWPLATMALLYLLARRLFDPLAGWAAALLYGVFQGWGDYRSLALNGELLMNLPVVASLVITLGVSRQRLRPELFLAGALVAVAFLLKQPAGIAALPLGLYLFHPGYRTRRGDSWWASFGQGAILTAGFVTVLVVAALLLARDGILREALFWSITSQGTPIGPRTARFWHRFAVSTAYFLVATAPLLLGAIGSVRRGRAAGGWWLDKRAELFALTSSLAVGILGVAVNGQFLLHYYLQLLPFLALLAAPWFAEIWRRPSAAEFPGAKVRALNAVLVLCALTFLMVDDIGLWREREPAEAALWVRDHSDPKDRIFVWGQGDRYTGYYSDAERRPASRYIAPFPLTGHLFGGYPAEWGLAYEDSRIVPGTWDSLFADFAAHPPRFVIDGEGVTPATRYPVSRYPRLARFLADDFTLVHRAADGLVYARKESGEGPPSRTP